MGHCFFKKFSCSVTSLFWYKYREMQLCCMVLYLEKEFEKYALEPNNDPNLQRGGGSLHECGLQIVTLRVHLLVSKQALEQSKNSTHMMRHLAKSQRQCGWPTTYKPIRASALFCKTIFRISNFPICHQTKVKIGEKCNFGFCRKSYGSDTKIQPWFRFPIPIPNFSLTLLYFVGLFFALLRFFWYFKLTKQHA